MLFKEVEASVANNSLEINKATKKDTVIHLMSGGGGGRVATQLKVFLLFSPKI